MAPSRIFLARHGERIDHVTPSFARTYPRPHDSPLTKSGISMAEKLGAHLILRGGVDPRAMVLLSSPLVRCVQTADGIVRGALQAAGLVGTSIPIFMEPGIVEGAQWMYFDMQKNPSVVSAEGLRCPEPLFYSAAYHREHTSPHVQELKPFSLGAEPAQHVEGTRLVETGFEERCARAAGALLTEPLLEGKVVVLVGHGETVLHWSQALTQVPILSDANPPYTGFAELAYVEAAGAWCSRGEDWATPHLPTTPPEN